MATIKKIENKKGPSWVVTIRIKGHPTVRKTCPSRACALSFEESAERKIRAGLPAEGKLASPPAPESLGEEKVHAVLSMFGESVAFRTRYESALATTLLHVGAIAVAELDYNWNVAYLQMMRKTNSRLGRPFAWETIVDHIKLIRMAVTWRAKTLGVAPPIFHFDAKKMLPPHWKNQRNRRLRPHEEAALRAQFSLCENKKGAHWALLLDLALETAARQSELVESTWEEFDDAARTWTIPVSRTKSAAERAIPLSIKAREAIKELRRLAKPEDEGPFDLLSSPWQVCVDFSNYVKTCNIKNLRYHDLRHEGISRMVIHKRKLSVYEIMKIVGHSSMEMLNRYANLRTDELVDRMD